jgi:hypothetical protein
MYSRTFQVPQIMEEAQLGEIKYAISQIVGTHIVAANFPTRLVTVAWEDPVTWEQIEDAILGAGYTPAHADKSPHGDRADEAASGDYLLNKPAEADQHNPY